ncbi:substrate-binding periplasmic protein [Chitinimonas sp. PSY-7]|uniref:substrate-binding periplasmic protein n=1 Tax=Chitinimonas sp. PSY-7 TaxID=3459088 RepID=UPI00403FD8B1
MIQSPYKKQRLKSAFLFCLILLKSNTPSYATDEFKDLVIYTENDPPYVTVDQNGKIGGLATKKLDDLLKVMNFPKENIKVQPWARSYQESLVKPNVMIYPIVKTPERSEKLEYIYKLYNATVFFFKLTSRKDIVINNLNDAKKYSVCAVNNDYRAEFLKSSGFPKIDHSDDSTTNVKKFIAGRCDISILTEIGLYTKMEKLNLDSTLVTIAHPLKEIDSDLYIAINKGTDPKTIESLKKVVEKLE